VDTLHAMFTILNLYLILSDARSKALCYKPEGREFETWRGEWKFLIYLILPAAVSYRVYSASNRSEYQKQMNNVSVEQSAAGA
jgi:hypothetical protein